MFEKMVWRELSPAILQFTYKKGKKKSKNGPKNRKKYLFYIMIKMLGIGSQIIFRWKSSPKITFGDYSSHSLK